MKDLFDKYVWFARILPGVLVMCPPVVVLLFASPAFESLLSKMQQRINTRPLLRISRLCRQIQEAQDCPFTEACEEHENSSSRYLERQEANATM